MHMYVQEMGNEGEEKREPIFKDIRRYYCEYCGLCRSKKALITSHILSHHQEEMKEKENNKDEMEEEKKKNTCEECGISFKKPAHLKQHVQSHSLDRPFICPVNDCVSSYRRKDHLTRHLLQHQGKLFECPVETCKHKFTYQGNLTRHMKEMHDASSPSVERPKEYVCSEVGCGKLFKYLSKLHKHEESHVKLHTVEALCTEPGCLKYFTNEKCLREHIQSFHQYIDCEICGTKQLKKNIKRHLQIHETEFCSQNIKCHFEGCTHVFSTKSNLNQHIKAVHLEIKPFACSLPGCGKRFSFKHVRDKHEKSGCHVYIPGDFEESDELYRSRPVKRKIPVFETLMRKRVVPPGESDLIRNGGPEYLAFLLSGGSEDED